MSKYTGKRIVPKPCGSWEKLYSYEVLSVVLYKETGDSYIARKEVPKGTDITDTEYWMLCSEYSAQYAKVLDSVEELELAVETLKEQVAANVSASTDSDADYAAEVVDARTGADGETYGSLGDAIRGVDNKKQDAFLDVTGEVTSGIAVNTKNKGQTTTFSNCWTTDFIPVNSNFMSVFYTGTIFNWIGIAGYDDDGNFVAAVFDLTEDQSSQAYTDLELDIPDGVTQIRASSYSSRNNLKITVQVDSELLWEYLTSAHLRIDDAEEAIEEVAADLEETVSDGSITIGHLANYSGSFLSAMMNDRGGRLAVGKSLIKGIPLAEADYDNGILVGEVSEDTAITGNGGLTMTFTGVANCPDTFSYTALAEGYGDTFQLFTNAWTSNYGQILSPSALALEDGVEKTFTVTGIRDKLYAAGYDDESVIRLLIWNRTTGVTLPAGMKLTLSNFVWSYTDDVYPLVKNSVTEEKIMDGAVTESKLADASVSEDKIVDGSVTGSKLGSGAVTEDKIADDAVTRDKMAEGAVMYQDVTGSAEDIEIAGTADWTGTFASKLGSTLLVDYDEESDALTMTVGADATSKNGGLTWKLDQSLLDYTGILYIELDLTAFDADGNGTVYMWEKNSAGSTQYYAIKSLSSGLVGTTISLQYDMAYRAVYNDMAELTGIIINHTTTTEGATFTIANLRVYQGGIWDGVSTYADDLPTFLKNLDSAVTKAQEGVDSMGVAVTELSDINIVSPSGNKYVFSINDSGVLSALPVVPDNILFMGNSLLSGFGTFGMAAQDSGHDYYHYVTTYLTETLGVDLTTTKLASSGFEGQTDVDEAAAWVEMNVLPKLSEDTRLVLIQLSDNVNTTEKLACFTDSCFAMTSAIRKNAPNARVAWVAAWYYSSAKQEIIEAACENTGSVFIDISDLKVTANQNVVGNTYINSSGVETEITSSGVASHPNSRGMLAIANRILYKLGITDEEETITDDTLDM